MLKIIVTVGIPGSGKSFWAKQEIAKDPNNWFRVNNDDIRNMSNNSVWSSSYEKSISDARDFLIANALKRGLNVIVDNLNISPKHWGVICKIAQESNKDVQVIEKLFFIELFEAIERDSKREGKAKVGEAVIKKWFKESGKESFKYNKPRTEIFYKKQCENVKKLEQDESLPKCAIFDNDGTISLLNGRSPYDASTCDKDLPHEHVIECMKLYHDAGYKIIFVSGREEKDRAPTERFYQKHFPEVKYELYMRPTGNQQKDVLIKEEIYNNFIKDKYYVSAWVDDRQQIVTWLFNAGFPVFRVNDPLASF